MAKQTFTAGQVLTAAEMNSLQENDYNWTVTTKTASYTLAAGDEGTRIVMNNAGATTITVDDAVFAAGDVVWVHNIGAGTCTITAGTATVNTAASLDLAQWEGGSLYFTSASAAIFFPAEQGGGGGLVVVKAETAFSAVSSVTADGVFTSDYTNYLVSVRYSTSSTQPFYYRLRASGTSTSANYNGQRVVIDGSGVAATRVSAGTAEFLGFTTDSTSYVAGSQLVLYGPQLAAKTVFFNSHSENDTTGPVIGIIAGDQSDATAFDGIELLVTTGTVTGSYTIYGYAQ